jgi:phosphatidyl-myo-inositol alpha-mannosyltransferase
MKILLATPFDLNFPGGVSEHLLRLDHQLQELGHTTRILAPRAGFAHEGYDGHVYRVGQAIPIPANGSTARITLSPFIGRKIKEILRREQFDVIHLHDPLIPTLPLMVLLHSRTATVATFHGSRSSHFGYNLGYLCAKPVLRHFVDKIHFRIAVSKTARDFINYYYPGDYTIIPNGIDDNAFGPEIAPIARYASDAPTILFVGRYDESRKGLRYLIEALALVQKRLPNCRLIVVGPGEPHRYERMVQYHGVCNVQFAGEVSKDELPAYYATCDVFCAPSTGRESFGIVLLEGMAAGKPVVATNIEGYRDVVRHHQEGILVEPKNPQALAHALCGVLTDPQLATRLGRAGRQRVREYSWPTVARRVVECYAEARKREDNQDLSASAASSSIGSSRRP